MFRVLPWTEQYRYFFSRNSNISKINVLYPWYLSRQCWIKSKRLVFVRDILKIQKSMYRVLHERSNIVAASFATYLELWKINRNWTGICTSSIELKSTNIFQEILRCETVIYSVLPKWGNVNASFLKNWYKLSIKVGELVLSRTEKQRDI